MSLKDDGWQVLWWLIFCAMIITVFALQYNVCQAQPPQVPETRLGQNWNEQAREQQEYSRQIREQQQIQRNTQRIDRLEQDPYYNTGWEWRLGY